VVADFEELADDEIDRYVSLPVCPIIGGFRVKRERGLGGRDVGDEGLEECGVHLIAAIVTGETPELVGECAAGPAPHLETYFIIVVTGTSTG
jgi:hypothetical protein